MEEATEVTKPPLEAGTGAEEEGAPTDVGGDGGDGVDNEWWGVQGRNKWINWENEGITRLLSLEPYLSFPLWTLFAIGIYIWAEASGKEDPVTHMAIVAMTGGVYIILGAVTGAWGRW